MALTQETIKANTELAGLTDQQVSALVQMSQNDENDVIGRRIGELYRGMDESIASATGIARNGDEKTYNYLKRATLELKAKADGAAAHQTEIENLKAEKTRLEEIVAKGGDNKEVTTQLERAKADLANVQKEFAELKKTNERQKGDFEKQLLNNRIENELRNATANLKFKAELPENVTKLIVAQTLEKVKGFKPQFEDDGKGGKVLTFHNEDGSVMRNAATNLMPYSAAELITRELNEMKVLDTQTQGGSGTKPTGQGGGAPISVSGAKTRSEFIDLAAQTLAAQGVVRGSKDYYVQMDKICGESEEYQALPVI